MTLKIFNFGGKDLPVSFVETAPVAQGVECDVYKFTGDNTKDLGIIRIKAGRKTPRQKILKGDKTIEGYISGKGKLLVGGKEYPAQNGLAVVVELGEIMQWRAALDAGLEVYEICFPPYKSGRFENLP